jgi:hypothetical protein
MEPVFDVPPGPQPAAKLAQELVPAARARTQPPPKPARATPAPSITTPRASAAASAPRPSEQPVARPSLLPASSRPPAVAPQSGKATPPPPPSRRPETQRPGSGPAPARPKALWAGRDAARVSIVKSTTEPGLYYVRLIENGKAPVEGFEGLLVALDPEATLCP